jgi:hypothetical protein
MNLHESNKQTWPRKAKGGTVGANRMSRENVMLGRVRTGDPRGANLRGHAEDPTGSGHNETGAVLILALIFLGVVGMVVGSLATWATNDLNNTTQFTSARTLQYAVSSTMNNAIENIRYTPLLGAGQTLSASPPAACWGAGSTSELTVNNVNVAVWCSTAWNPSSAQTRVVSFSACPVTPSQSGLSASALATACVANPTLTSIVTYGDYPPGFSAPNSSQCIVYCGTSMTINSWVWAGSSATSTVVVPTTTTTTTTVPPTTTTVPPTTTTTTTVPPTTTTVPPTTTTTTTTVPPTTTTTTTASNSVTATPTVPSINPNSGTEQLSFNNPASITSLSITIRVVQSTGVTFHGQWDSFPGDLTDSVTTSNGVIVYTYVLNSGQTVPANNNSAVDAQWAGTGTVHSTTTDTYSVTSTSGGVTSTVTGHF